MGSFDGWSRGVALSSAADPGDSVFCRFEGTLHARRGASAVSCSPAAVSCYTRLAVLWARTKSVLHNNTHGAQRTSCVPHGSKGAAPLVPNWLSCCGLLAAQGTTQSSSWWTASGGWRRTGRRGTMRRGQPTMCCKSSDILLREKAAQLPVLRGRQHPDILIE